MRCQFLLPPAERRCVTVRWYSTLCLLVEIFLCASQFRFVVRPRDKANRPPSVEIQLLQHLNHTGCGCHADAIIRRAGSEIP